MEQHLSSLHEEPMYQRVKTPMIDRRGTDWLHDPERQKQCDEYEQKTKGRGEFGVQALRTMGPIYQIAPSSNPEDWGIKKEWILETHRALEGHYTRLYIDPTTGKKMLLWQGDEKGGVKLEYDSEAHRYLADRYVFFRITSLTPPGYHNTTHPRFEQSKKVRTDVSHQIFEILDNMEQYYQDNLSRTLL